jgi:hypothetical protein
MKKNKKKIKKLYENCPIYIGGVFHEKSLKKFREKFQQATV